MASKTQKFFIVDDDESVRRALMILLTACGFQAKAYSSAEAFFESVSPETPGCLILDIHLPGLDGWEVRQRLLESGSDRPVIIISADESSMMMKKSFQTGAVGYLQKPFQHRELLELIRLVQ